MTALRCTWHDGGERCPDTAGAVPDDPPYRVLCHAHQVQLAAAVERTAAATAGTIAVRAPHA